MVIETSRPIARVATALPAARRSAFCWLRCARNCATRGAGKTTISLDRPRPGLTPLRRVKHQPPPVHCAHSLA
jgi:hypothetical protein